MKFPWFRREESDDLATSERIKKLEEQVSDSLSDLEFIKKLEEQVGELRAMLDGEKIDSSNPFTDALEGDPGAEALGELKTKEQIDALFYMVTRMIDGESPKEIKQRVGRLKYLDQLRGVLEEVAQAIMESFQTPIEEGQHQMNGLVSMRAVQARRNLVLPENDQVRVLDNIFSELNKLLVSFEGILKNTELFLNRMQQIPTGKAFEMIMEKLLANESLYVNLEHMIQGYLNILEKQVEMNLKILSGMGHGFMRMIEQNCEILEKEYGVGGEKKREVPFIKNNGMLTDFLYHCYEMIPDIDLEDSEVTQAAGRAEEEIDSFKDQRAISAYADYLDSLADLRMLSVVSDPRGLNRAASAFQRMNQILKALIQLQESKGVPEVKKSDPTVARDEYNKLMERVIEERGADDAEPKVSTETVVSYLQNVDFSKIPSTMREAGMKYSDDALGKQKQMLDIFQIILDRLVEVAKEKEQMNVEKLDGITSEARLEKWESFIKGLIGLKAEIVSKLVIKDYVKRLEQDQVRENFCYEVIQKPPMGVFLLRNPSTQVKYDDVFGASWQRMRNRIQQLILDYSKYRYVETIGSPRGKKMGNVLLISPPGCGKNLFMEALMNDSGVIGIKVRSSRFVNPYIGAAESNAENIFRMGEREWFRHEKPVVLSWDEMDTIGDSGDKKMMDAGDRVNEAIQTTVQAILEGDKQYEGLFLFGLTNKPNKFSPPFLSRFADVEVIQGLTVDERVGLMKHLLASIPLTDDFDDKADWKGFKRMTENVSGRTIGKMGDKIFEIFKEKFKARDPEQLQLVNREFRIRLQKGEAITAELKRTFFAEGHDLRVTPDIFEKVLGEFRAKPEFEHEKQYQVDFYEHVDRLLAQAYDLSKMGLRQDDEGERIIQPWRRGGRLR